MEDTKEVKQILDVQVILGLVSVVITDCDGRWFKKICWRSRFGQVRANCRDYFNEKGVSELDGNLEVSVQANSFDDTSLCITALQEVMDLLAKVQKDFSLSLMGLYHVKYSDYVRLLHSVNDCSVLKDYSIMIPGMPPVEIGQKKPIKSDRAVLGPKLKLLKVKKVSPYFRFDDWFKVMKDTKPQSLIVWYMKEKIKKKKKGDSVEVDAIEVDSVEGDSMDEEASDDEFAEYMEQEDDYGFEEEAEAMEIEQDGVFDGGEGYMEDVGIEEDEFDGGEGSMEDVGEEENLEKRKKPFFHRAYRVEMVKLLSQFLPYPENTHKLKTFELAHVDVLITDRTWTKWINSTWGVLQCTPLKFIDVHFHDQRTARSEPRHCNAQEVVLAPTDQATLLKVFNFPNLEGLELEKCKDQNPQFIADLMAQLTSLKLGFKNWQSYRTFLTADICAISRLQELTIDGVDFVEDYTRPIMELQYLRTLSLTFNAELSRNRIRNDDNDNVADEFHEQNRNTSRAVKRQPFQARCRNFVDELLNELESLTSIYFEAGHVFKVHRKTPEQINQFKKRHFHKKFKKVLRLVTTSDVMNRLADTDRIELHVLYRMETIIEKSISKQRID
jgi:hypothetical protein